MNNDAMREWLAVEVCKWERADVDWFDSEYETDWQRENEQYMESIKLDECGEYYIDRESSSFMLRDDFNPFENADQALMVLDTFGNQSMIKLYRYKDGQHQCVITIPEEAEPFYNSIGVGTADNRLSAICIAACRASGMPGVE